MAQNKQPKRGMRHVIMAVLAAVLVIGPSFMARIILDHSQIHIAYVALGSLAMFLVGAYLTNARTSRTHAKFVYTDWDQAIKFD